MMQRGVGTRQNAHMPERSDDDLRADLLPSRLASDLEIAREAGEVISHLLGDGRSVIDPSVVIWTAHAAENLRARVEDNPIVGTEQGQWEKLDLQLAGADRAVVLLAAEIVFLREHALLPALPTTRRKHVDGVLSHLDVPAQIPERMSTWLSRPQKTAGFVPGQRYNGELWRHVIWVTTFVVHWHAQSEADREAARSDPWELQRLMLASGEDRSEIRSTFQFLARPDAFEPISSSAKKAEIRAELADRIGGATGDDPASIDHDLFSIRAALAPALKGAFDFWTPGVRELWDASWVVAPQLTEPRRRHYWLYSPGKQASEWEEFSESGIMAIGWDELDDLATYPTREAIRQALDPDDNGGSMKNAVLAVWQFQNEIAVGDIVYAKRGRREIVGRGEVVSEPRYEPGRASFRHVRAVRWTHRGAFEHPGDTPTKTLTDITSYHDYVEQLEALVTGEVEVDASAPTTPLPRYDRTDFLSEVYLTEDRYERLHSLVTRKKNVILAGPPGVGKTFAAKRLAYSIMGVKDPSRVQMVQFHQSYSYEDFMMGYRPTETGGFTLTEGPFYRFCEEARADDEERPYFFIVDEINRGNISKVFGELLMLIEADKRGQELRLLYKNETFSVPRNVHILGMMNTADRSLAVLDYALRRRFGFFEIGPGFDSAGFMQWRQDARIPALDRLVGVVVELNAAIADDPALGHGFAIGHSFLSRPSDEVPADAWLTSVVEDELVPLLGEYWFDEPSTAQEWVRRLRAAVA